MSEDVKTIRHIIQKEKTEPTKTDKSKDEEIERLKGELDERDTQILELARIEINTMKEELIEKYPHKILEIQSCSNPTELEALKWAYSEDEIPPKAPTGKATLIEKPSTDSLTQAENEGSLINRLYRVAQKRHLRSDAQQLKQKQLAREQINKMYKSLTSNPNLGREVKRIGDSLSEYATCPKCGEVVEGLNPNAKGSICPSCKFVVGQGSYHRVY